MISLTDPGAIQYTEVNDRAAWGRLAFGQIQENYSLTSSPSYGAMEITLSANNTADTKNPYVFLKELSTNGDVNTVDVVYPTSTILGVMSPDWIKYLLEPVAMFSKSPVWTAEYVVHDLGSKPDLKQSLDSAR